MTSPFRISVSPLACRSPLNLQSSGEEMASSIANFDEVSRILYSREIEKSKMVAELRCSTLEGKLKNIDQSVLLDAKFRDMENAKLVAELRCSIFEPKYALFRDRIANLKMKINDCPSNSSLCSMITELHIELQSNRKGEKDRFRLLDQKYRELERFSFGVREEADKYKRMSDQHLKHVENVEKELALLRAREWRGQEEVHQLQKHVENVEKDLTPMRAKYRQGQEEVVSFPNSRLGS